MFTIIIIVILIGLAIRVLPYILKLIGAIIFISLLISLWRWFSDSIWPGFANWFSTDIWPIIIANGFFIANIMLLAVLLFIAKRKITKSHLNKWINKVGFCQINWTPNNKFFSEKDIRKYLSDNIVAQKYLISIKLRDKLSFNFNSLDMISKNELAKMCIQIVPSFNSQHVLELADCMHELDQLLPCDTNNETDGVTTVYLTHSFVDKCKLAMRYEGMCTVGEFADTCQYIQTCNQLTTQRQRYDVAEVLLNHFVEQNDVKEATTLDNNDILYQAANPSIDTKMIKREINLN